MEVKNNSNGNKKDQLILFEKSTLSEPLSNHSKYILHMAEQRENEVPGNS